MNYTVLQLFIIMIVVINFNLYNYKLLVILSMTFVKNQLQLTVMPKKNNVYHNYKERNYIQCVEESHLSGFLDSGHTRTSSRASSNGGLWLSFTASQRLLCWAPTFRSCTADTDLWTVKTPVPRVLKTWDISEDRGVLKPQLISPV